MLLTLLYDLEIPYIHLQDFVEDPNERVLQMVLSLPSYKQRKWVHRVEDPNERVLLMKNVL